MADYSDPLTAETAWLSLLRNMQQCNEGMQISLYQLFAADHPSYATLCNERIQELAQRLIEQAEGEI